MPLERLLQSQGFGSRKEARGLIEAGRVRVDGLPCRRPEQAFDAAGLVLEVDGTAWPWREQLYLALHKPAGFECSRTPQHHASVFSLLPAHFVARGVQAVGRLDADTTGLLLLTDDGAFNHGLASPKRHIPKTYRVTAKHALTDELLARLLAGVQLHDEPAPLAALACRRLDETVLEITIDQGKYHQVKRMVAAAGNRVEALHRTGMGEVQLGAGCLAGLAEGQWCELDQTALALLRPVR
ncbi:pseudouridine synthase [Chitinimonas arctica]|uniref:Pseudouridine synthase n=1 Tax=Chitinimonas arctica TaxID=2594795 RepID=A0A516SMC5_9NEIS|nr:pseudouridine synthase [Chitinimonas arctica]